MKITVEILLLLRFTTIHFIERLNNADTFFNQIPTTVVN